MDQIFACVRCHVYIHSSWPLLSSTAWRICAHKRHMNSLSFSTMEPSPHGLGFASHFHSVGNNHQDNNRLCPLFIQEKSQSDQHVFHMSQADIKSGNNEYKKVWKRFVCWCIYALSESIGWDNDYQPVRRQIDQSEFWNIKQQM